MPDFDRTLIIPVETQVREFDPKILFACAAAEQGYRAFVGSQTAIHLRIDTLPQGIYIAKDIRDSKVRMMRIMRDLGHRVVAWDEEGLVRYPSNHYFKTRVDPEALDRTDLFFAWGREDADTLKAYPGYKGTPVFETGNPRIDLLRKEFWPLYEDAAKAITERFGRYILINTNFGHSNHFLASQTIKLAGGEGLDKGTELGTGTRQDNGNGQDAGEAGANGAVKANGKVADEGNWDTDLAYYRDAMFQHFLDVIPKLARAFPDTTIILRPHPAESHEAWIKSADGCTNVKVIHEGSVVPWIFGADVMVHNGCTTAIEASLLERPAVTYRPMQSERFDRHLPDSVSYQAFDVEALIAEVSRFVGQQTDESRTEAQKAVLDHHLAVQNGRLASDQIVDILKTSSDLSAKFTTPAWTTYMNGWMKAKRRMMQKRINSYIPGSKNSLTYEKHRFPEISEDEVNRRIGRFAEMLGRFEGVRARKVSDGIFKIEV